jgi:hypothetical protein
MRSEEGGARVGDNKLRTLEQIEEDLNACREYNTIGTLQAAYRYMNDLRTNMLTLVKHVQAQRLETQPAQPEEKRERSS